MLNGNVHSLVDDIEILLQDICEFLGNNVNDGFSKEQKLLAEKLIKRSKTQLQTIAKLAADVSEPDTSYVDMTPKASLPPKPDSKDDYPTENYSTVEQFTKDCPYKSLSASEAKCNSNQWGYLERKKTMWFLGHQIKQLFIIVDQWMLIYLSEKDPKPIDCLDLEMHYVKYVDVKDVKSKKDARSFELISPLKNYQFLAKNAKDMDQWITAISKVTNVSLKELESKSEDCLEIKKPKQTKTVLKELPPLPQVPSIPNPYMLNDKNHGNRESLDNYDPVDVTAMDNDDDEKGENIYECPILVNSPTLPKPIEKHQHSPPPLPPPLDTKPKYFLHSQRSGSQRSQHSQLLTPAPSIEVDDENEDEEVEYDLPLNEKMQAERKIFMNQQQMETVQSGGDDVDDDPQGYYDEVVNPIVKPEIKPKIHALLNKADSKILAKNKPKQKFAGINRTGSYSLRDN